MVLQRQMHALEEVTYFPRGSRRTPLCGVVQSVSPVGHYLLLKCTGVSGPDREPTIGIVAVDEWWVFPSVQIAG